MHRTGNPTLAITLAGRTGNVLFEMASGMAIAEHYGLDLCIDPNIDPAMRWGGNITKSIQNIYASSH